MASNRVADRFGDRLLLSGGDCPEQRRQAVFGLVGAAGGLVVLIAALRSRPLNEVARRPGRASISLLGDGCVGSPLTPSGVGEIGRERWISRTDRICTGNRSECARDRSESTDSGSCPFPARPLEA